jgi:hypothetical protein
MVAIIVLTIQHNCIERRWVGCGGNYITKRSFLATRASFLSFLHSFSTSFTYHYSSLSPLPSFFTVFTLYFSSFFSLVFRLLRWFLIPALLFITSFYPGARGGAVVEALRYKPEGRGFESRWRHNPSGRTMALESTQPLTEMSTRNISWG